MVRYTGIETEQQCGILGRIPGIYTVQGIFLIQQ